MGLSRWWLDRLLGSAVVWCWLGDGFGARGGPVDSWLAVLSLVVLRLGGFGPCRGQVVMALMGGVGGGQASEGGGGEVGVVGGSRGKGGS